jgi:hypothetical protein
MEGTVLAVAMLKAKNVGETLVKPQSKPSTKRA